MEAARWDSRLDREMSSVRLASSRRTQSYENTAGGVDTVVRMTGEALVVAVRPPVVAVRPLVVVVRPLPAPADTR